MRISVCIPIFNQEVAALVNLLHSQLPNPGSDSEILLLDDGSSDEIQEQNRRLEVLPGVSYLEQANSGRAVVRNNLAKRSKGTWLLFLDCDMMPVDTYFLARYIQHLNDADVLCGGIVYPRPVRRKDEPRHLRWRYGIAREEILAEVRNKNPWQSFMTGNFMIKKETLLHCQFDETVQGYGHEDTLFGKSLQSVGAMILHVQNPAVHLGIDSDPVFLDKTKNGIRNLAQLYKEGKLVAEDVRLLYVAVNPKKWKYRLAARIFAGWFNAIPPASRTLRFFDAWRLRLLMRELRKVE